MKSQKPKLNIMKKYMLKLHLFSLKILEVVRVQLRIAILKVLRIQNQFGLKWFYSITLSILLFASCDPLSVLGGIGSSEQYSLVPTEGLSTDSIPQKEFFYVNLSASYYYGEGFDPLDAIIYAMDEGPGTDCKIAVGEDSTEDLYCILDVMEGDLFFHKIVLEYNVPPEMCQYSGFIVPYHLNQPTAKGPTKVATCGVLGEGKEDVYCVNDTNNPICEEETNVCLGANGLINRSTDCDEKAECENSDNSCGGADSSGSWEEKVEKGCKKDSSTVEYEGIDKICGSFDKSENDLQNCCFGSYKLDDNDKEVKWGGDFKTCIGGPGRVAWNSYNKSGEPITEVTNTFKKGLKETYELDAIINVYDGYKYPNTPPSFITANFWGDAEDKEFLSSDLESQVKVYFPEDPNKSGFTPDNKRGNPYFVWTCLDRAKEIKHRIILLIREWNTQAEYNNFKESLGSNGDPDVVGEEGSLCDYYTSDENDLFKQDSECNDFLDLDDWQNKPETYPEVIYKDSN